MLTLDKVAKFYGHKLIFKKVSLSLGAGEIMLVAGPNGAGKSTLLKIMGGLLEPDAGSVDTALPDTDDGSQALVGYVGHHTFVYPQLSAVENLSFWAGLHGRDTSRKRMTDALARMELEHVADERAGSFSRGMAQRLSLARVFLLEPSLILLDEPGTGLDVRSMDILYREIAAARERGAALAWVSHQISSDLGRADLILSLDKGRVAYCGPVDGYVPSGESSHLGDEA